MVTRRTFMKSLAGAAGATALVRPIHALSARRQASTGYFQIHQFIEAHPEAVFIMHTDAAAETGDTDLDLLSSTAKKKTAGLAFGRSVFVPSDEINGVPLTISIPVKSNIKTPSTTNRLMEHLIAHVTDPYFLEGCFEGIKELGVQASQIHVRETSNYGRWGTYGYTDMVTRTGVDLRTNISYSTLVSSLTVGKDFNWLDVPNGIYYNKIPYLEPINTANTFMLNMSKFKSHGMGLTLCCKNLQGSVVHNYQKFCQDPSTTSNNPPSGVTYVNTNAYSVINANYNAHRTGGVPRWDRGPYTYETSGNRFNCGLGMEFWATKALDNISVTPCKLHVIEGIVAREGQGDSDYGPVDPSGGTPTIDKYGMSTTGKAVNYLSNVIIFGKNIFNVDIIGMYLGGHEPGNIGLFHCAKDRGMLTSFNPWNVPVYIWDSTTGTATLTSLNSLTRTPLRTYYLAKTTENTSATRYHMLDEEYTYTDTAVDMEDTPRSFLLHQNYPNPFNPNTSIEYVVPKGGGQVRLEVFNASGQLVEVIAEGRMAAGSHMAVWNAYHRASGTYFYRYRCNDFTETRKMVLLK